MANISEYLARIQAAVLGEEVRGSIHDAIDIINKVSETQIDEGTAVTNSSSSSAGFYDGSLYINTETWDLWKCIGVNSWLRLGNLKGANGNYWYKGTALTGTGSEITGAAGKVGDFYINANDANTYQCVQSGNETTALWNFVMILGGGASAIAVVDSLVSTSATDALSANQGRLLDGKKINKPASPSSNDVLLFNGTIWDSASLSDLVPPIVNPIINPKLDDWHKVSDVIQTLSVNVVDTETTIQFTNLDNSGCYELWFDTTNPSDPSDQRRGEEPIIKSSSFGGSGTECTLSYVVEVPVNPTYFRLIKKGNITA